MFLLEPIFHWDALRQYVRIRCRHTLLISKREQSKWKLEKLSNFFHCHLILAFMALKHPARYPMKLLMWQKDLNFFISSLLKSTGSLYGMVAYDTSALHFLHSKSVLEFRWPCTSEQHLCTQRPRQSIWQSWIQHLYYIHHKKIYLPQLA